MNNGIYVAYVGKELTSNDIKKQLGKISANFTKKNYTYIPKIITNAGAIFGQINDADYDDKYTCPCIRKERCLYVADAYEIDNVAADYINQYELDDEYYELLPALIEDYDEVAFKLIQKKGVSCSYVFYDIKTKELTAVRIGTNTDLYFGYTKQFGEIVFSTNEEIIQNLCGKVSIFPNDAYYKNGQFHQITEEKKQEIICENADVFTKSEESKKKPLFNDFSSAKNLLDCLNEILSGIADTRVRASIEDSFNDYFASLEAKKKVSEFVDSEIEIGVKNHLLEIIKAEVEKFPIQQNVAKELDDKYRALIDEAVAQQPVPKINIIRLNDIEIGKTSAEFFHEKFEEVLQLIQLDEPVMLIGPAGSGKNHLIAQIAQALGKKMYYTNNASNEFKLTGFIDAGGHYRDTEFYKAFKNGGIFFLDEIDTSDPSALIVINSALANGYMAFPHETIDRHPNFRMVAAANTWGKGSDLQYIGRNALDGATLDRFDNIFFDYDRKLERGLYPNQQVLEFMWSFRDSVDKTKIPHIVSTRGIGKVYKKEINGIPIETILRTNIIRNLGQDDLNTILGNMEDIDYNNKYYSTAKSLQLIKKPQQINEAQHSDDESDELPF